MDTNKIYAEQIANEYSIKDESKVIALRKLDRKAKAPANVFVYTFGILMALVFGLGMCLSMQIIGGEKFTIPGIVIGIIGMLGLGMNYPIYKIILKSSKEKYAYDIIKLANEVTQDK